MGGVLLLSGADRQLGLCVSLASVIPDHRTPWRVTHPLEDILRARILAIACGYADANDHDDLRRDPAFKLACGRLPERVTISPRSRRSHAGRTRLTCAPCCGWATR